MDKFERLKDIIRNKKNDFILKNKLLKVLNLKAILKSF